MRQFAGSLRQRDILGRTAVAALLPRLPGASRDSCTLAADAPTTTSTRRSGPRLTTWRRARRAYAGDLSALKAVLVAFDDQG